MLEKVNYSKAWMASGSMPWSQLDTTYGLIHYDNLPKLRLAFNGGFSWLTDLASNELAMGYGNDQAEDVKDQSSQEKIIANKSKQALLKLQKHAAQKAVKLPQDFMHFFTQPALKAKIPSCTDNYFELSEQLLPSPNNDGGYLIRFMVDSQTLVIWYLYLHPNGLQFIGTGFTEWQQDYDQNASFDQVISVKQLWSCAPSFEEFLYRYWLENKLFFYYFNKNRKAVKQQSLTTIQQDYIEQIRLCYQNYKQL